MEDLVYFTKAAVQLADIAELAAEEGFSWHYLSSDTPGQPEPWLNVLYAEEGLWQWVALSDEQGDFDAYEPADRAIVLAYQPASAFLILHNADSWPVLSAFLARLLDRYGGWDGFEPILTAATIQEAAYPYQPDSPPSRV